MSKEQKTNPLEALKKVRNGSYDDYHSTSFEDIYSKEFDMLEQALTPPTAEAVCEALSVFLQGTNINASVEVTFENNSFMYFHTIVVQDVGGHLWFDFPVALPTHLISLICGFFEEKNRNE